ncbi:hypothetical protein [Lactiplantibacillus plantarum]|uniref:hypothetical protein n=1 Tax=Lactiplantibacillus plantarum TaxID=1590 RepID=UPI0021CB9357|nr:hypothetical protein [Lactiplantibacillus plantarum]
MSLGLIENLVSGGDYDDLMSRFENYMRFGTNTPRGELLDIGRTCAHAIGIMPSISFRPANAVILRCMRMATAR